MGVPNLAVIRRLLEEPQELLVGCVRIVRQYQFKIRPCIPKSLRRHAVIDNERNVSFCLGTLLPRALCIDATFGDRFDKIDDRLTKQVRRLETATERLLAVERKAEIGRRSILAAPYAPEWRAHDAI
jgi:hypothetical protein